MSASTSKLEMSLDEIIKTQKKNVQGPSKKFGTKSRKDLFKKRQVGIVRSGRSRRQIGFNRKRIIRQGLKKSGQTNTRKRVVGRRTVGIGKEFRTGAKNNINAANNVLKNRAMITATKNLVKKLVKRAIVQNVVNSLQSRPQKIIRIPANRPRQRTIVLSKLNANSRVIARRQITSLSKLPVIVKNANVRGPVRFIPTAVPTTSRRISSNIPRRRRNKIQYVQQRPAMLQQAIPAFMPNNSINNMQSRQGITIREQINAMRRATRVQQLQSQFIKQQNGRSTLSPRQRQQAPQVIQVVKQQQPLRRKHAQQYILIQQQQRQPQKARSRYVLQKQFSRHQQVARGGRNRQQVITLDPLYNPPNYLQRF